MKRSLSICIAILITLGVVKCGVKYGSATSAKVTRPDTQRVNKTRGQTFARLPLRFEPNVGQSDPRVKFLARGPGYSLLLTPQEAVMRLSREQALSQLRMRWLEANHAPQIIGQSLQPGLTNNFTGRAAGQWRQGIVSFGQVKYDEVWKDIDLIFYGNQQQLEYDFRLAPGADPARIRMAFDGAERVRIDPDGALVLEVGGGEVRWLKPVAYQVVAGQRHEIACRYRLTRRERENRIEFALGAYDRRLPLVIDPALVYSTFLGGFIEDYAYGVAVDEAGNTYVAGSTNSPDFLTVDPVQPTLGSRPQLDAFVLKIAPNGGNLVYATYLGGAGTDIAYSIVVDVAGNAYVTGETDSTDFPKATVGARQQPSGYTDAFLVKLSPSGSQLVYSNLLGGSYFDRALGVAIDANGNAYVAGQTDSPNFPLVGSTRAADFTTLFKSTDAAANWSASANGLPNSTVRAIAFNPNNNSEVFAATALGLFKSADGGAQWAAAGTLPSISGAPVSVSAIVFDSQAPSVIYLSTSAGVYKSFNGGQSFQLRSIGLSNRNIAGLVINPVQPATLYAATPAGVFKTTDGGETWLANNSGLNNLTVNNIVMSSSDRSTLYVGTARGVFKTTNGGTSWVVASNGLGPAASLPAITALAIDPVTPMTLYAAVNATGTVLFKTIDGGANWRASDTGLTAMVGGMQTRPVPAALAIHPAAPATIYAATPLGVFKTTDGGGAWSLMSNGLTNLNITALAIDPAAANTVYAGSFTCTDAFVTKVNASGSALIYSLVFGGGDCDIARGIAVDAAGAAWVTGDTMSANFPTVIPLQARIGGASDSFVAKVNPAGAALSFSTFLGGGGAEAGNGIALDAAGNAIVVGETSSSNFPAADGYKNSSGGGTDGFIAKYKADGSAIEFTSYFGGNSSDQIFAVSVDKGGDIWVTGTSSSFDFPEVRPLPNTSNQSLSAFVSSFSANGKQLIFSSRFGGGFSDVGRAITVDAGNNVYLAGIANSFSFPLINPVPASNGTPNGFAVKLGPVADLAVTIAGAPSPVLAGERLTYTVNVANLGDLPLTGVRLTDQLPAGSTLVSATATQGVCSGASEIVCDLGSLAEVSTARVTIVVTAPLSPSISNTARVSGAETEPDTDNNTATATTQIVTADLALVMTPSHLQIAPGGKLTWLLSVRNLSGQRIPGVRINNTLPAETTFISCAAPQGGICGGAGNDRTATIASLDANGSATVMMTAMVNGNVAPGSSITNVARLEPTLYDPNPNNNEARVLTMIVTPLPGETANGLIAFGSVSSGYFGINLIRPDGGGRFLFSAGQSPAWSPDGTKLVVNNGRPAYVINADGTGLRQLTAAGDEDGTTWSPDGTRVAFYRFSDGIFIINADGTGERNILRQFTGRIGVTLKWSPDGTKLLIAEDQLDGLYVFNIDGSGVTRLTTATSANPNDQPDWSPDGTKIVFVSRRDNPNGELYLINADGSGLVRLTNNNESERYPAWSPDGKKIAYGGGGDIVIINADGTSPVRFAGGVNIGLDWQRAPANQPRTLVISGRLRGNSFDSFASTMVELTGTRNIKVTASTDGFYSFGLLPEGGTYTVRPSSTFFRFNPQSRTFANLTADQVNTDFTSSRISTVVRGRVTDFSGAPMAGVSITASNNSGRSETDAEGNYVITGLSGSSFTITPGSSQSSATFEPAFVVLPPSDGDRVANFKGTREPFTLSGRVTDGSGAAVADVSITLDGGGHSASAITNSQGIYSFPGLPSGYIYTVSAAKTGIVIAPATRRVVLRGNLDVRFFAGVSPLAGVSAPAYDPHGVTVAGMVALFGQGLATTTRAATGSSLPLTLEGVSVHLTNRNFANRQCGLFFVSPQQINAALPAIEFTLDDASLYAGEALIEVRRGAQVLAAGSVEVERVAPGIFTADSSGRGLAAAVALRVRADNTQVFEPVFRFDPQTRQFVAVPIDIGNSAEQVFLVLFTTGVRYRIDAAGVRVKIANEDAMVSFAGPAPGLVGGDQVNALIPRSLVGRGEVEVVLIADGRESNRTKIHIR
jgi:uncharacterized protein (TIGR03437 family)